MEFILYSWRQSVSETTEKLKYRFTENHAVDWYVYMKHTGIVHVRGFMTINYLNSEYMYIQSFIIGGNPPCSGTYDFLKLKVLIYKIILIHQ